MGADNSHLRVKLEDRNGRIHTLIAFGHGYELGEWEKDSEHRLLVTVEENIWNLQRRVQLRLVDHRGI